MIISKKFYVHSILFGFFLLFFCGCAGAGDVDKAKEFVTAGMYPQAMELLNKRITEKPTDAEAHFQLGICYANTGNFSNANDRFGSAVKLKADYGFKIGSEYKKLGDDALTKENLSVAQQTYLQAIKYQPDLKNSIADNMIAKGKTLFESANHQVAENYFRIASDINPGLKETIADYYFQAGSKPEASVDLKTAFFDIAYRFNPKNEYQQAKNKLKEELAEALYSQAQKIEIRPSGAMPLSDRQALISKLSEKIALLEKVRQYTNRYEAELKEDSERLILEQSLVKYEEQWGPAKIVELSVHGKWESVCTIPNKSTINYLSLHEFKKRDNVNKENVWKASPIRDYEGYRVSGSTKLHIEFSMKEKPTQVYYWIINS